MHSIGLVHQNFIKAVSHCITLLVWPVITKLQLTACTVVEMQLS